MISRFTGRTDDGIERNIPAIAIAKTATTSHVRTITKIRNIIRIRGVITLPAMSAMVRPPSRTLSTKAPKSCTAPMKMVPSTTQISAGRIPQ